MRRRGQPRGHFVYMHLHWSSPWRIGLMSNRAYDLYWLAVNGNNHREHA